MTMLQQDNVKSRPELPRSSDLPVAPQGKPTPTNWRMLVIPRPIASPRLRKSAKGHNLRIDGPTSLSKGLGAPHFQLNWSESFGWHDSTAGLEALDAAALETPQQAAEARDNEAKSDGDAPRNEQLAELVAQAAHDIRAPLVTAKQIVDFVVERASGGQPLAEKDIELLTAAGTRLKQADQWAEEILLERNLSVRGMVGIRRRFHPHQWRNSISPLLESIAEKHNVKLRWLGWDRSLPRLYVDPNHLSRLVMNLATNAIEASQAGSIVCIRVAWQASVTRQLAITIEDRGMGLDAEVLQRLNAPTASLGSRPVSELGVGLRTSMALVNCIGGSISAQRRVSGGTVVGLSIPVDDRNLMIRHWLIRNARASKDRALNLTLHEIRTLQMDNMQVDRQLQLSSLSNNLVYRLANDRWAWLSLDPRDAVSSDARLSSLAERLTQAGQQLKNEASCQFRLAHTQKDVDLTNLHSSNDPRQLLPYLSNAICYEIDTLLAGKIPPVDEILPENDDSALLKPVNPPKSVRVRRDAEESPVAEPSRLFDTSDFIEGEEGIKPLESASDAISDMAKQWRAIQAKLERLSEKQRRLPAAS